MSTLQSLSVIHDNIRDLYTKKKTGLSTGKYVLNSDLFPNEDLLTEQTFFQAYRNWLRLLDDILEPDVASGWHKHHDLVINNVNFSSSFLTWKSHDRHRCTSFNAPFMLDVDSRTYIKGFDCEWMASKVSSFWKDCSNSPLDSQSFHGASRQNCTPYNSAHNSSFQYNPYDKQSTDSFRKNTWRVLCL